MAARCITFNPHENKKQLPHAVLPPIDPSKILRPAPLPSTAPASPDKLPLRMRSPVLAHLRSIFFTGMLTAIPIFITVYIITIIYGLVTKFTKAPADWMVDILAAMLHNHIPADALKLVITPIVAVMISLFFVYILGLLGTFFVGRQILAQAEHFISNLPLIKGIYGTTKQVLSVFRQGGGGQGFQRVVLVEFPRIGTWTVAFVTNTVHDASADRKLICCFIPMTPNPTSGFFQMFPEDEVRNTDWTVDLGIKIVLSGGLLAPSEFKLTADPSPARPPVHIPQK